MTTIDRRDAELDAILKLELVREEIGKSTLSSDRFDKTYDTLGDAIQALEDPITEFQKFAKLRTQKELGALLISTIVEATYDVNWEGYTPQDKMGIRKFLDDLMASYKAATRDNPEYYNSPDYYFFTGSHMLTRDMPNPEDVTKAVLESYGRPETECDDSDCSPSGPIG